MQPSVRREDYEAWNAACCSGDLYGGRFPFLPSSSPSVPTNARGHSTPPPAEPIPQLVTTPVGMGRLLHNATGPFSFPPRSTNMNEHQKPNEGGGEGMIAEMRASVPHLLPRGSLPLTSTTPEGRLSPTSSISPVAAPKFLFTDGSRRTRASSAGCLGQEGKEGMCCGPQYTFPQAFTHSEEYLSKGGCLRASSNAREGRGEVEETKGRQTSQGDFKKKSNVAEKERELVNRQLRIASLGNNRRSTPNLAPTPSQPTFFSPRVKVLPSTGRKRETRHSTYSSSWSPLLREKKGSEERGSGRNKKKQLNGLRPARHFTLRKGRSVCYSRSMEGSVSSCCSSDVELLSLERIPVHENGYRRGGRTPLPPPPSPRFLRSSMPTYDRGFAHKGSQDKDSRILCSARRGREARRDSLPQRVLHSASYLRRPSAGDVAVFPDKEWATRGPLGAEEAANGILKGKHRPASLRSRIDEARCTEGGGDGMLFPCESCLDGRRNTREIKGKQTASPRGRSGSAATKSLCPSSFPTPTATGVPSGALRMHDEEGPLSPIPVAEVKVTGEGHNCCPHRLSSSPSPSPFPVEPLLPSRLPTPCCTFSASRRRKPRSASNFETYPNPIPTGTKDCVSGRCRSQDDLPPSHVLDVRGKPKNSIGEGRYTVSLPPRQMLSQHFSRSYENSILSVLSEGRLDERVPDRAWSGCNKNVKDTALKSCLRSRTASNTEGRSAGRTAKKEVSQRGQEKRGSAPFQQVGVTASPIMCTMGRGPYSTHSGRRSSSQRHIAFSLPQKNHVMPPRSTSHESKGQVKELPKEEVWNEKDRLERTGKEKERDCSHEKGTEKMLPSQSPDDRWKDVEGGMSMPVPPLSIPTFQDVCKADVASTPGPHCFSRTQTLKEKVGTKLRRDSFCPSYFLSCIPSSEKERISTLQERFSTPPSFPSASFKGEDKGRKSLSSANSPYISSVSTLELSSGSLLSASACAEEKCEAAISKIASRNSVDLPFSKPFPRVSDLYDNEVHENLATSKRHGTRVRESQESGYSIKSSVMENDLVLKGLGRRPNWETSRNHNDSEANYPHSTFCNFPNHEVDTPWHSQAPLLPEKNTVERRDTLSLKKHSAALSPSASVPCDNQFYHCPTSPGSPHPTIAEDQSTPPNPGRIPHYMLLPPPSHPPFSCRDSHASAAALMTASEGGRQPTATEKTVMETNRKVTVRMAPLAINTPYRDDGYPAAGWEDAEIGSTQLLRKQSVPSPPYGSVATLPTRNTIEEGEDGRTLSGRPPACRGLVFSLRHWNPNESIFSA